MTTKRQIIRMVIIVAVLLVVFFGGREIYYAKYITRQSLMVKLTGEDLAKDSSLIVEGKVIKSLGAKRFTDENGELMVNTHWQVKLDKSYKGEGPATVIIQTPGGRYGLTEVVVEDAATLIPGEKVLLYLNSVKDKGEYQVVGEFQGKFDLTQDASDNKVYEQQETKELKTPEKVQSEIASIK